MIAYLIHFGTYGAAGVVGLLINLLVFALVILVIFWVLGLLGVPAQIQRVIAAILALILILSLFSGCTIIPTQHGKIHMWADYEDVSVEDGSVHFRARKIASSTVARTHWHGATSLAPAVAGFMTGGQAGTAAAVIPALVNRPTTRASQ